MIRKAVTTFTVIAGMLASNLAVFATSASAGERNRHQGRGPHGYHRAAPHYAVPHHQTHRRHYGTHHRRGHNGAAVAVGIGALILGTVLATEARRHHRDRYDD